MLKFADDGLKPMRQMARALSVRLATSQADIEAIHRLNYAAFVEEIPQHPPNTDRRLVDRFHDENTYVVAKAGDEVIGMVCFRGKRPFSLDAKLGALDDFLPPGARVCEIRLLYIVPKHRSTAAFLQLARGLFAAAMKEHYELAVISGTTRQIRLYKHLGFVPFGPLVGSGDALFQPMLLSLDGLHEAAPRVVHLPTRRQANFSTGPVALSSAVSSSLAHPAMSHRSEEFSSLLKDTHQQLRRFVNVGYVSLFCGSGTAANEAIALQLRQTQQHGLILSNGEFGSRLIDIAKRTALSFDTHALEWGASFDESVLRAALQQKNYGWVWAVATETSTGIANNQEVLKRLSGEFGVRLCLDCMSAVGVVPLNLNGVHLASASSGKGLASVAGLGLVFANEPFAPLRTGPASLDLTLHSNPEQSAFTIPSLLVSALNTSLSEILSAGEKRFQRIATHARWLDQSLRSSFHIIGERSGESGVISIQLPDGLSSRAVGIHLRKHGVEIGFESRYLRERNWIQVALMGSYSEADLQRLPLLLQECVSLALKREPETAPNQIAA